MQGVKYIQDRDTLIEQSVKYSNKTVTTQCYLHSCQVYKQLVSEVLSPYMGTLSNEYFANKFIIHSLGPQIID